MTLAMKGKLMADSRKGVKRGPQPVYFIFQVKDDDGKSVSFDKNRLEILAATRDTGVALSVMEEHGSDVTYYKRVAAIS
jgi:hypothetical protein